MTQWRMPPRNAKAVKDSLFSQAARRKEGITPSAAVQQQLLDKCLKEYPHTTAPRSVATMDREYLRKEIASYMEHDVVKTANPGFPLASLFATNQKVVEHLGMEFLIDVVLERMEKLLRTDITDMSPVELVKQGLCDPIRAFVKNESHPLTKQLTNRWRIISSVSIVDQLIDRLLHTTQNKVEIALWQFIPSAPGLGLSSDADGKKLIKRIERLAKDGDVALSDVSGFDWSVQEWEILLDARARCELQAAPPANRDLIMKRANCLCTSLWVAPDGVIFAQTFKGVVKSGTYNTSSTNSRIRAIMAWLAGALWAVTMGDDCVEEPSSDAERVYKELGHPLRKYEIGYNFDFCSFDFDREAGTFKPSDPTKTLHTLLAKEKEGVFDLQALQSFIGHVRNHPDKKVYFKALLGRATCGKAQDMLSDALNL